MKTKQIPAIIMLLAGLIASILGIYNQMDIAAFTKMLLIVLCIFYVLGCIVKIILDKNFPEMTEEDTEEESEEADTEKENIESDGEEEKNTK